MRRPRSILKWTGLAAARTLAVAVLGAVTTIAVSWGLALWQPIKGPCLQRSVDIPERARWRLDHDEGNLYILRARGLECHLLKSKNGRLKGNYWHSISALPVRLPLESMVRPWARGLICPWMAGERWPYGAQSLLAVVGRGWPMPALFARYASTPGSPGQLSPFDRAIPIAAKAGTVRGAQWDLPLALPLGPIWTGLAANTACYSAAWLLLLLAPAQIRRLRWARAGRCTGCGYDRAGLEPGTPCPECGRAAEAGATP